MSGLEGKDEGGVTGVAGAGELQLVGGNASGYDEPVNGGATSGE